MANVNVQKNKQAWIVSVSMGYGHQRTAYPLRNLAPEGKIISANNYSGIPLKDKNIWEAAQRFYELVSRIKRTPLIGNTIFSVFDAFQKILSFYPERERLKPNFALRQVYSLIKKGWGKDLIGKLRKNPLPLISTFFTPAFMAEFFGYPGQIFCIVCDADIARTWAPLEPKKSKIKYFAPSRRVVERLKFYGVKKENIFLTGYPLPLGNIGTQNIEVLKEDMRERLVKLDPKKRYFGKYKILIEKTLGKLPEEPNRPLTIMFSVGGAGAQKEIGLKIVKSLRKGIEAGEIKVILSAGIKQRVKEYFEKEISGFPSSALFGRNLEVLYRERIEDYFEEFNQRLRKTDILWTKPSELSFYSALGLPIIIAPPIGSQEEFNKQWLLRSGFGELQEDPKYTGEWLLDWLKNGYLAEAAMEGFIKGEKLGTLNIKRLISY